MGRESENTILTLEEYAGYFRDRHRLDLTVKQLNQIAHIHGFLKLYGRHKMDVAYAMGSIELMAPARSTLQQSISCCAPLKADELRADLRSIGWEEPPIPSLAIVGSVLAEAVESHSHPDVLAAAEIPCAAATAARPTKQKSERTPTLKRKARVGRSATLPLPQHPSPSLLVSSFWLPAARNY